MYYAIDAREDFLRCVFHYFADAFDALQKTHVMPSFMMFYAARCRLLDVDVECR